MRAKLPWARQRWAALLVFAAAAAMLVSHAYLGSYSRFMADDYCSAAVGNKLGILRAAWLWYRTWTGRYSANVLDAVMGRLGPGFTPAVTALVLLAWLGVLSAAIHLCLTRGGRTLAPVHGLALSSSILGLTLILAPNVPQALYWGQGMRSVVPPLIGITLDVALFSFYESRSWSRLSIALWLTLSFILAYGAGGFSETYASMQVVVFGLALAWRSSRCARPRARNGILFLGTGFLGAALSFVTILLAPGNPVRAAFFPPPPPLLKLMSIAVNSYGQFLASIFEAPVKLSGLLAAVVLGVWTGIETRPEGLNWKHGGWTLLAGAILTFSCFAPAAYGESDGPPERTLLIPTFLLVLAAVLLGLSVSAKLAKRTRFQNLASYVSVLLTWSLAAFTLSRMFSALPTYTAYAEAWDRFHTEMVSYQRDSLASVAISTADLNSNNWPGLNVLGDNPKFWLNKCVSDYYGVHAVISTTP